MYEYGIHGLGMLFKWFFGLLLIGIVVYFASGKRGRKAPSAKEILDRRYADGEIDTLEYKKRLKELQS